VELLGNTWVDVGWNLQTIEKPADVPTAFVGWEQEQRPYALLGFLLRQTQSPEISWPSDCRAFGMKLDALNRQLNQVGESIGQIAEHQQRCRELFDRAMLALNVAIMHLPVKDQQQKGRQQTDQQLIIAEERAKRVAEERAKRKRTFELAKDTHVWLNQYYRDLDQTLKDGYAYFVRSELVRFRDSHRRRLNPWNIANALAGLPFIGYRQSLKRCAKLEREKTAGVRYEIFLTLRRIIKSQPLSIGPTSHAKTWLQNKRPSESLAISELQQNWYHLQLAIETVSAANIDPEEKAFKICREYFRRITNRSPVDELLETDERISPVIKYSKRPKN
jgi:hypothetical protein